MSEYKQPNARCPFCAKVFYITPSYVGNLQCMHCGTYTSADQFRMEKNK